MQDRTYTTGEVASLRSVTLDSVPEWIKRRRLQASPTAGGHCRIELRHLAAFAPARAVSCESAREPKILRCRVRKF